MQGTSALSQKVIIRSVCEYFQIAENDLRKNCRYPAICNPRQFAAYLLRYHSQPNSVQGATRSYPDIARALSLPGQKPQHYTTVMHGVKKVRKMLADAKTAEITRRTVENIQALFPNHEKKAQVRIPESSMTRTASWLEEAKFR